MNKSNVVIDIKPIWTQTETRRKRSLREPVHKRIDGDKKKKIDKIFHLDDLKLNGIYLENNLDIWI